MTGGRDEERDGARGDGRATGRAASRAADRAAVEAANTAFYEAVERGDFDTLSDLWLDDGATPVSCVHPGWPVLSGRGEVLRSYALIMANTDYIQFFLTDVEISLTADIALVTCTENILSGGPAEDGATLGPLVGQLVVATNVFRRTPDGWKVWSHHGSPVMPEAEPGETGEHREHREHRENGESGDGRGHGGTPA
ncbi:nuclear transport factor 2 family protein [Streptomyces sp. NPDC048718]|uniref:nuclear transport factor 2 family protein n=1 Tax=Streptomyces sp. NPDC048718 TaxID=3365587 RepID=UPI0037154AF6